MGRSPSALLQVWPIRRRPPRPKLGRTADGPLHAGLAAAAARRHRGCPRALRGRPPRCRPDYCFPARLDEIAILEAAVRANPRDARAPYYLGNLLYDRRRHEEAIQLWERSRPGSIPASPSSGATSASAISTSASNAKRARAAYDRAFQADPDDARLLFERDQLWKRLGEAPARRLREAGDVTRDLVPRRDDLSVELCALYNQTGQPGEGAGPGLTARHFQPWEGGEGGPWGQWARSHLMLGRAALEARRPGRAPGITSRPALTAPPNLGEAKHLLANQSDIHFWLGCAWPSWATRGGRPRAIGGPPPTSPAISRK